MEILITIFIVLLAIFIIYKNIKKSSSGSCNCSNCHKDCSMYNKKNNIK